jgi:hypothetical protein
MCNILTTTSGEGIAGNQFEGALAMFAIVWVVAQLLLYVDSRDFPGVLAGQGAFPLWLEMLRLMVLLVIWQVYLTAWD